MSDCDDDDEDVIEDVPFDKARTAKAMLSTVRRRLTGMEERLLEEVIEAHDNYGNRMRPDNWPLQDRDNAMTFAGLETQFSKEIGEWINAGGVL